MKALGIHLLIELYSCNRKKINDLGYLERVMSQAAEVAGATYLEDCLPGFQPAGRFRRCGDRRIASDDSHLAGIRLCGCGYLHVWINCRPMEGRRIPETGT